MLRINTIKLSRFLCIASLWLSVSLFAHPTHAQTHTPYKGYPWPIPGTIQVEDFDKGGNNSAYADTTPGNQGGHYRPQEDVDIYVTNDGSGNTYEVANVKEGEWLKYSVNVTVSGTYTLYLRAAAFNQGTGAKVRLSLNQTDITGPLSIVNGVWQGYSTIKIPEIYLEAGLQTLTLHFDTQDPSTGFVGSFNWIHFEQISPPPLYPPIVIPTPSAEKFYVSPQGSDTNPGTLSHPWKTITKAAHTLTAGQTVFIRQGTYNERLIPQNSGAPDAYIIYTNYPGETVTIDGTGISMPKLEGLVNVDSVSFIRVSGLRILNAGVNVPNPTWNMGIMAKYSNHLVIDHNYVAHTYSLGINLSAFTHHSLVTHNEVTDHFGDGESTCAILWFAHHNTLSHNYVHHSNAEGINTVAGAHHNTVHSNRVSHIAVPPYYGSGVGIYSDSWTEHTHHNTYYNNWSHDNYGSGIALSAEAGGLLEHITFYNNLVYANRLWGVIVSDFPWDNQWGASHPMSQISLINNTIFDNDKGTFGYPGIDIRNPQAQEVVVTNNISSRKPGSNYPLSQLSVVDPNQVYISHNLYYGGVSYPGSNPINANPLFIDPLSAIPNLQLQSTSPAINSGSPLNAPDFDFNNHVRPYGTTFDIGAYEFGSSPPSTSHSLDTDDDVDILDFVILISRFGLAGLGDFNQNGKVDITDYSVLLKNRI